MSNDTLVNIAAVLIVIYWFKEAIIMAVAIIAKVLKWLYCMLYRYVEHKIGGEVYNTGDRDQ